MLFNFQANIGFFSTHYIAISRYSSVPDNDGLPVTTQTYLWTGRGVVTPTSKTRNQADEGAYSVGTVDVQVPYAVLTTDTIKIDNVLYTILDIKDWMAQGGYCVVNAREVK